MNRLEDTLKEAIRLVEPTPDEEKKVSQIAEELRHRVEEAARDQKTATTVELGGSYAKGTWLKGDVDIDIFVKFDPNLSKKRLEEIGVKIGKKALADHEHFLRYSEHPYVEGIIDGVKVNVVACYDVKEGAWQSAADRSPYHTRLIQARFDDRLKKEARLLKLFMKGAGLYGAEIKTQGFSGYVCEVLILKYGAFHATLEAASKFREGEIVSVGEIDQEAAKRFQTPLTILDPVDPARNLGAAISPEKAAVFTLAARAFLKQPRTAFFTGRPPGDLYSRLEKSPLRHNLLAAVFRHKPRMVDILWGQLKRSENHLAKHLSKAGFGVLRSASASDERGSSCFVFLLESQDLPPHQVKTGPKVEMEEDVETFLKRNRGRSSLVWIGRDRRIYALGERRHRRAADLLGELLRGVVSGSGVAPGLKKEVEAGSEIFAGEEILKAAADREWLIEALWRVVSTDELGFGSD